MNQNSTGEALPPYQGLRILDFTRIIAGPLCTQTLADLGAEVIKVENPDGGDDTRRMAQPSVDGDGHFFLAFNRTKKSVALDISKPEGRAVAIDLASKCDVVMENFRPGVMKRLGLGPDELRARFPGLIYLSVSAYGQTGPMSDRPGFDPVVQAEFGMMSITGPVEGPPTRHALSLIDTMTALYATIAILSALKVRGETGKGQYVDLALMDTAVAALGNAGLYYLCSGENPKRSGNAHMTSVPTNMIETADGGLYMALSSQKLFRELCVDVLERPDLPTDPRFETPTARNLNRVELYRILTDIFRTRTRAEWLKRMRHLPAGAVRTISEALESEEVKARHMVQEVPHPAVGSIRLLGTPFRFSDMPTVPPVAPPSLGQHTAEVLRELAGYDEARIERLRAAGIIKG